LIYDYTGFPPHTYELQYPAPGEPALAEHIVSLLKKSGLSARTDPTRGFDHGIFIPFLLAFAAADIPVVPLSLTSDLDPGRHLAAGRALSELRNEGVLIVGSGMSYHNLAAMFSGGGAAAAESFDSWLNDAVQDPGTRDQRLAAWRSAPGGRESHPREEHLIPLMVAAGAAGEDPGVRTFSESIAGKALSGFQFG